ncbi:MAG: hypothetical protein RI897_2708 [Verrucomicrobiota bacterium]
MQVGRSYSGLDGGWVALSSEAGLGGALGEGGGEAGGVVCREVTEHGGVAGVGLSGGIEFEGIDVVSSVPGVLVESDDLEVADGDAMGEAVEPAASGMEGGLSIGEAEVLVGVSVDPSGDGDKGEEAEGVEWRGGGEELEGAGGEGEGDEEDGEGGFSICAADGAGGDPGPVVG